MARARNLRKRIEIWQTTKVPDGFGGNTIDAVQLTQTWADIRTLSVENKYNVSPSEVGIFDPSTAIRVKVRKRRDLTYNAINQFIVYNGQQYLIVTNPTNPNFNNQYIEFIAALQATKNINPIAPIGGNRFPYTFNFLFDFQNKQDMVNQIYEGYETRVEGDNGTIQSEQCSKEFINDLVS